VTRLAIQRTPAALAGDRGKPVAGCHDAPRGRDDVEPAAENQNQEEDGDRVDENPARRATAIRLPINPTPA
jgi:hypothetical protein